MDASWSLADDEHAEPDLRPVAKLPPRVGSRERVSRWLRKTVGRVTATRVQVSGAGTLSLGVLTLSGPGWGLVTMGAFLLLFGIASEVD